MDSSIIYFLIAGGCSGTLAGLLGIGGGMIIVPVIIWVLNTHGYTDDNLIKIGLATSLAIIIPTSISSACAHHRSGALRWNIVFRLLPGILIGTVAGGFLVDALPDMVLKIIFAVGCFLVAFKMVTQAVPKPSRTLPSWSGMALSGMVIGSVSAMLGIGGGTLTVPFLNWCNVAMRNAVATSSAVGLPVAIVGAMTLMLVGLDETHLPEHSVGYVYLPALIGMGSTAVLMAPVGAKLTHHVPVKILKQMMAAIILIAGLKILYSVV